MVKVIFFGSTTDSVLVLEKLLNQQGITIAAIVTQPAKPIGRKHVITPTKVEVWAKSHNITVLTFSTKPETSWEYENRQTVIDTLQPFKAELLISASYGQKIPAPTIESTKFGGLNIHPSLLPRFRGTDPVPWTILAGDHQTGVTLVTLSPDKFDVGNIIAQKKIPVSDKDTTIPLREKLFTIGAELLILSIPDFLSGKNKGIAQVNNDEPYARRLTREDGFEPWEYIQKALTDPDEAIRIECKFRAFLPWPGLWTTVGNKRLKILKCHLAEDPFFYIDTVQPEGKKPVPWEQYKATHFSS